MRAGELACLEANAVVQIGAGHWLRIPLGKLRNDHYVPLRPGADAHGEHAGGAVRACRHRVWPNDNVWHLPGLESRR